MNRGILAIGICLMFPLRVFAVDPELIKAATTDKPGAFHIVIRELITSKNQSDWTSKYNATVEVFKGKTKVATFAGSTLPNFKPGAGKPADWEYSVVMATCAFPAGLRNRYYTWIRESGKRDQLRLAAQVPTVNVGDERMPFKFLTRLISDSQKDAYRFATGVLVHSGSTADWRGSAGCLTIAPADAAAFFSLMPVGAVGTLELARGIEDESAQQSYCY